MAITDYLSWYWETFGIAGILIFLVLIGFIFRKYLGALVLDYIVDGFGSFIPIVGDFFAGIIIFFRIRKVVGNFWAIFAMLEAWNFGLHLIFPPAEFIFGATPTVTIVTFFFSKEDKAKEETGKFQKNIETADNVGIDISEEKKSMKKIEKLMKKGNFVKSLNEVKKTNENLIPKIRDYIDKTNAQTNDIIKQVTQQMGGASGQLKELIEEGLSKSQSLAKQSNSLVANEDYENAVMAAKEAIGLIKAVVEEYNKQTEKR